MNTETEFHIPDEAEAPKTVEHAKRGRPAKPKMLPVRLLKGYVPAGDCIAHPAGGEAVEIKKTDEAMTVGDKLHRGMIVELQSDEARKIVKAGIAERADEF